MLFGGNPRYENMPLIGRGSPPPTVPWAPAAGWAAEFLSQGLSGNSALSWLEEVLHLPHPGSLEALKLGALKTQGHGISDLGLGPEDRGAHVRSWVSSKRSL